MDYLLYRTRNDVYMLEYHGELGWDRREKGLLTHLYMPTFSGFDRMGRLSKCWKGIG